MPPANSPVETSTPQVVHTTGQRSFSPSSFLPAFQRLTSPVLDLAATLTIQAEDDIDAENIAFLRTHLEPTDDMNAGLYEQDPRSERRRREGQQRRRSASAEARERRFHESRLDQLRQRHDSPQAWSDRTINHTRSPYGDGLPSHQSLFDWAPARDVEEELALEDVLEELRQQQPNTHPEILRALARATVDADRESRHRPPSIRSQPSSQTPQPHEPSSLRSTAILQSFRRNHRILARSREFMQRLATMDRDGTTSPNHTAVGDRRPGAISNDNIANVNDSSRYELNRLAWQTSQHSSSEVRAATHRENLDTLRRRYLENPSHKMSEFERIIKYLHILRSPDNSEIGRQVEQQEDLAAMDKRHLLDNAERFKLHAACPPHPTSWLAPGMLFTGTQHANPVMHGNLATSSSITLHRLVSNQPTTQPWGASDTTRPSTFDVSRPWLSHTMSSAPLSFSASPPSTARSFPTHDRWTVKVEIHAIDYDTMTLQGTMEAYNVPSLIMHSSSSAISSVASPTDQAKTTFSTYLEGELIDFTNHTLLTEPDVFGVKTTPDIDAAYWRRLEPFTKLTDDEIARALLDRRWIEEQLMDRYVLMRWKERCFVKPTFTSSAYPGRNAMSENQGRPAHQPRAGDTTTSFLSGTDGNGYGLSISGFYYVSLRRSDGRLEGLYFDPQSSPYQHLEMRPSEGRWGRGTWEFR